MAVQEQTPLREYTANGVTTSFALGFDCEETNHLIVTIDDVEVLPTDWYLSGSNVIFWNAPSNGKLIKLQRNTPFNRLADYQSYNNSFRPPAINKDFDRIWWKLQELGVADWILHNRIDALKAYVDDRDDELRAYLMEEIRKQGVALDQLDEYYDYLMQRLAQIAVDKGWDASLVVDGDKTQKQINDNQAQINSRTATPYDFGAIGDGVAHPLSERFPTLAAAQAVYPSATSLDEYIDGHALNAWWRDICANNRKFATCHGEFVCNTKISNADLNSNTNTIKTKRVDFNAVIKVTANQVTNHFWEMISTRQCEFSGFLDVRDLGGLDYNSRKFNVLIYLEDFIHGVFKWKVVAKYARYLGMLSVSGSDNSINKTTANNNCSDLGHWQFDGCGHRFKHKTFNFYARAEIGDSQGVNQRNVLTVNDLDFSTDELVDSILKYKDKPYLITANTANTIECYPWFDDSDTTGTFELSWGGDFRLIGADSNQIKMSSGSTDCAICAGQEGFYVGFKDQRVNEFCDVGLRLGRSIDQIQRRLTLAGLYFEGHVFDIVKTSISSTDNTIILNPNSVDLSKCHSLVPLSSSKIPAYNLLASWTIVNGDRTLNQKKYQYASGVNPTTALTVQNGDESFKLRANSAVITLSANHDKLRLFGLVDVEFEIFGTASNNGTSGVTTLKCEEGFKINNSSSDFLIPASDSAFKVSARLMNNQDWRVYVFYSTKPTLQASVTYDPQTFNVSEIKTWNVTLTGAKKGDYVVAAFDGSLNGTIILDAQVTSNNLVTIWHWNPNQNTVSVSAGNLTVKIL